MFSSISISIAKTCDALGQLFTHICIDAMSFFSIEIAILTREGCRVSHNPTDFILCTTTEEAEITIPSFTEFMVYTQIKFMTVSGFYQLPLKPSNNWYGAGAKKSLYAGIYICFAFTS